MKKNDFKNPFTGALTLLLCMALSVATAQDMYISNGATLHYSGGDFASGVIDNNNGGTFSVSADYVHSADNYVDGSVAFLAAGGTHNVSLESGAPDRVPNFTATNVATVSYNPTAVPTGTPPSGYVLADAEVYTFTGAISAGSATPLASTGFGAATGTTIITIFANANGGTWSTTATAGATSVMSFAKEAVTLGIDGFNAEAFGFYPNPVKANANSINFNLPSAVQQLSITMYNVTGKVVQQYNNVPVQAGANSINKPQVAQGLYLLQFSFNKGEQTVTKRVIIE